VAAIGAVGREALRREGIFKKIRIGVGANPALVGDLKISLGDVGEQRGQFERPDFELNPHAPPLFLQRSAAPMRSLFFRETFQRQTQAHAVRLASEARGFEKLFGAREIVRILRDVRSGVSTEVTRRRAPRFGDLFTGLAMKSSVLFTSAEVSGRPSWKRTPLRR
jgi:hypothetical protein